MRTEEYNDDSVNNPNKTLESFTSPEAKELEEEVSTYPEDPESEDSFRGYKIAPVEEGLENAPFSEDIVNDPWNETNGMTVDNINMPGDKVDEYYEQLGSTKDKQNNILGPDNYDTIPK